MRIERMLFIIAKVLCQLLVILYGDIPNGIRTQGIVELKTVLEELNNIGADKK